LLLWLNQTCRPSSQAQQQRSNPRKIRTPTARRPLFLAKRKNNTSNKLGPHLPQLRLCRIIVVSLVAGKQLRRRLLRELR
jgi:hypothetical protein